jgi:soluble lytic murein transglycosylase-like protein
MRHRRLGDVGAWRALAERVGRRYGVDPALILAIIEVESGGNPQAANPADPAYGLMQVTPATAQWLAGRPVAPDDLLDPETNVDLGTRYLRWQLDRYAAVADAVDAYRAGTASGTPRSQAYVDRVLSAWIRYGGPPEVGEAVASTSVEAMRAVPSARAKTPSMLTWGLVAGAAALVVAMAMTAMMVTEE